MDAEFEKWFQKKQAEYSELRNEVLENAKINSRN